MLNEDGYMTDNVGVHAKGALSLSNILKSVKDKPALPLDVILEE